MIIGIPKEKNSNETRIPLLPQEVKKLSEKGANIVVESNLGQTCHIPNEEYDFFAQRILFLDLTNQRLKISNRFVRIQFMSVF
jgi:alanine dehydrogenase